MIINIGPSCDALYAAFSPEDVKNNNQIVTNAPARLRMTALYMVSAMVNGRVVNTCNLSEDYVGYSTKYGDAAGDFSPLGNYTVSEIIEMGLAMDELDDKYVLKTPDDGMSGKSDEDNFGFTYTELDNYIRGEVLPDVNKLTTIKLMHSSSRHKYSVMPTCPIYNYKNDEWYF